MELPRALNANHLLVLVMTLLLLLGFFLERLENLLSFGGTSNDLADDSQLVL